MVVFGEDFAATEVTLMPIDSKKYRDYLHQTRSHPETTSLSSTSKNTQHLYWSVPCFLVLEWFLETRLERLPPGLSFPFGFLLFWAFYYTYLKPGHLESKLQSSDRWENSSVVSVVLEASIWFVKIVFVELSELLLIRWLAKARPSPKHSSPKVTRPVHPPIVSDALPKEIENALSLLGLKGCRDWNLIHKRYRELAKKFHPDLNPDITVVGNRFIIYDGAYRRLSLVKEKYFKTSAKS